MTPVDFLWLFFLFSALQPVLKQRFLEASRQRLIARIERQRNSRVILLVHRQETMSILGFPIFRYIDVNDSEEVMRAIHLTDPEVPLDIVLHTPGGLVLAALQIARAIHKHPGKVTAFVPHYAMSGGTLLALAADEIIMDENAVLGPVDPQVGAYPAASVLAAVAQKDKNRLDDQTLILADISAKAVRQARELVREILQPKLDEERASRLAEILTDGRFTHDYPITHRELRGFGLEVSLEMPRQVYALMELYPQPPQARPSVQYIRAPYFRPGGPGERGGE
ncbi:MAG: ATP-dependent Clp protease proteolytic subunit [Firmicutes bacterium]|nr:ATP-dependent Clp protease proteolytic subunit [Bacillota bacterium]